MKNLKKNSIFKVGYLEKFLIYFKSKFWSKLVSESVIPELLFEILFHYRNSKSNKIIKIQN